MRYWAIAQDDYTSEIAKLGEADTFTEAAIIIHEKGNGKNYSYYVIDTKLISKVKGGN